MAAVAATLDMIQPGVFTSEELKRAFGKEALIQYCKQNDLSHAGTKPDLVHRILDYLGTKKLKKPASPKSSQSPKGKSQSQSSGKTKGKGKEPQKEPEPSPKPNTRSSPSRDQSPSRGKSKAKGKGKKKEEEKEKEKENEKEKEKEKEQPEEQSEPVEPSEEVVTQAASKKKAARPKPVKAPGKASPPKPATPKQSSPKPTTPKSAIKPATPKSKPGRSPSPLPSPARPKASPAKSQTPKQKEKVTPSKAKTPGKTKGHRDASPSRAKSPARNKASAHDPKDLDITAAKDFFQFHPLSFFDDVVNAITDNFHDGADDLEAVLKKEHPADAAAISKGLTAFLADMQASVNANFDRFEVYGLRNVFQVPHGLDAAVQLAPVDQTVASAVAELGQARRSQQETAQELARANQELITRREQTAAMESLVASLKATQRPTAQLAQEVGEAADRLHTEVRRLQGQQQDSLVASLQATQPQPRLDPDIELLGKDLTGAQ